MNASKRASRRYVKSDLLRGDAHAVKESEFRGPPELTEDVTMRATVNRGGRPRSANPRRSISLRLPADVIERWRATGPGWQTRMAEELSKGPIRTGSGRRDSVSLRRA